MRTILGPFHPELEDALVDEIATYKRADLLTPLLILVPSDLLRRRLKLVLSRERQLSLLNVQLLTFHQLACRLHAESGAAPVEVRGELFFEEAVRRTIRSHRAGTDAFVGLEERAGGCAALWQTLRDLRDGLVEPVLALEALAEGHFGRRTSERTEQLLLLFQAFREFCQERNIIEPSTLERTASEFVSSSRWLQQFAQVFYYGFYDLTQIQLDFFYAVARDCPTTVLFPLLVVNPSHQGWRFAERFYERYVQGHATGSPTRQAQRASVAARARLFDEVKGAEYAPMPKNWRCQFTSAFGLLDEVSAAAKEILKLNEDDQIPFHEIGVVARSLESYGPIVSSVFDKHHIPVAGVFDQPLAEFPLVQALILLLNLPAKDFVRNHVIDLVSSPYFQREKFAGNRSSGRPEIWDLATRELAICKGIREWRRLHRFSERGLILPQISDDAEPRKIHIAGSELTSLAQIVESLSADLSRLPPTASWQAYAAGWKGLLKKYLGVSPDSAGTLPGAPAELNQKILSVLDELADLDLVQDRVTVAEFSDTFQHWLKRSTLKTDHHNRDGVLVLDATAARGLRFRALFILGVNEGVFPRTIREDAFLRDQDREVLERDLGYKVSQKLPAFDEEKLLFTLLVGAAQERLYCSFQRSDDDGRVLAPSWYIDELKRAIGASHFSELVNIARGLVEKAATPPFDRQEFLLPSELAVRLTLTGENPTALVEASQPLPCLYKQGRQLIARLDRGADRLHGYDGIVGKLESYWTYLSQRGLTPTALETYARCPFQFFARHVLGLEPLDYPEEIAGPSPAEYGELGHEILKAFYGVLIDSAYFSSEEPVIDVETTLQAVANRAFAEYEADNPVGYPLVWESVKESLVECLREAIARDLGELRHSGFAPVDLETDVSSQLPSAWPAPLNGLKIRGRMDRIDRHRTRLRVIDYKFKFGATPLAQDKNLLRAALRGERLQPPFYYWLAQRWAEEKLAGKAPAIIEADFYYIAPRWSGGPLVVVRYGGAELDEGVDRATRQSIAYLTDGVRDGRFFINRAEHCARCEIASICRKNHPPSLWRAENDPITLPHRQLREKKPGSDD
jgi:ATP-dependent helicase/nuclease subunit B